MSFLIDEMYSPAVATRLNDTGHDASHVHEAGLAGADDADVLAHAAENDRTVVTENAADFIPLLDARTAAGQKLVPVVTSLKRNLPPGAGSLEHALAKRLSDWAAQNPDPYHHAHWLG